jgi:hypothetical protein
MERLGKGVYLAIPTSIEYEKKSVKIPKLE